MTATTPTARAEANVGVPQHRRQTMTGTVDPARASLVTETPAPGDHPNHFHIRYVGSGMIYDIKGYSDGTQASCSCPNFFHSSRRPQSCKHTNNLIPFIEQIEYERQCGRKTYELQADESDLARRNLRGPDAQRALNAIRRVLRDRGVRTVAAIQRGREAAEELFGGAA